MYTVLPEVAVFPPVSASYKVTEGEVVQLAVAVVFCFTASNLIKSGESGFVPPSLSSKNTKLLDLTRTVFAAVPVLDSITGNETVSA